MVSAIVSSTSIRISYQTMEPTPDTSSAGKGKSAQSVGQMAKAEIALAGNDDLPANIQGKVASAMARGLDITALLAPPPSEATQPVEADETADTTVGESDVQLADEIEGTDTGEISDAVTVGEGDATVGGTEEETPTDVQPDTESEVLTALSNLYSENAGADDPVTGIEQLLDDIS